MNSACNFATTFTEFVQENISSQRIVKDQRSLYTHGGRSEAAVGEYPKEYHWQSGSPSDPVKTKQRISCSMKRCCIPGQGRWVEERHLPVSWDGGCGR